MNKGVLLYCFDTPEIKYHSILERCVGLVKENLKLPVTVVTDFRTFKQIKPVGFVNYKLIEPELGNTKMGKTWINADRHMSYELSPYDVTLVLDIDYFCFSDNLLQFMDTKYDFLIPSHAHDLTNRGSFDHRRWSMIPMVWATVFVFKKTEKAKRIFSMIKYVKKHYSYFNNLYRIYSSNLRNDYVFAIALQQLNGFVGYDTLPINLASLPADCEVVEFTDRGLVWKYADQINYTENQDVHVLNKGVADV